MFTSRAEHRLLLRIDNADLRLTPRGREIGLVDDERWEAFEGRRDRFERNRERRANSSSVGRRAAADAGRPGAAAAGTSICATLVAIGQLDARHRRIRRSISTSLETEFRYEGYLERQEQSVERLRRQEVARRFRRSFAFDGIPGLSREMVERLSTVRPETLGQASRIPGVTPAAVALVARYIGRAGRSRSSWTSCVRGIAERLVATRAIPRGFASEPLAGVAPGSAYYDLLVALESQDQPHVACTIRDEAIDRLLLEPLAAARNLPPTSATLMDLGSGGGLRRFRWRSRLGATSLVMVESKARKAAFLREARPRSSRCRTAASRPRDSRSCRSSRLASVQTLVTVRAVRLDSGRCFDDSRRFSGAGWDGLLCFTSGQARGRASR